MVPLENQKWARVKEIFGAALEQELARRATFLREVCAGDEELRAEIESLLAFDAGANSFIERPAFAGAAALLVGANDKLTAGSRLGAYRVLREIGRGGMGAVYLAERADDEYRQEVAVKIVPRAMSTDLVLGRFRQERQILAGLDHPHIARLLDGGTTEDGRPYLIMEHVRGTAIDRYADANMLSVSERLRLFRAVCAAVSYAHRNLVVHCDLKPSNILITPDGVPKLLDFGIARLLNANAMSQTASEWRALTPDYASPEQLRGETVTTASDVYSLGVVLDELLRGAPHPRSVGRGLIKDLPHILRMARQEEPGKRYASVEQLSEDIRRSLKDLPVLARPDTFRYRAGKFMARNKISVAAAALAISSLIAGAVFALTQARRATAQARLAREQRIAAERASARAEKTNHFLQNFLTYANPNWYGRGKGRYDVTVREAIDDVASRIDTELPDEPEVRADLHYTVGEIYRVANEHERALRHFGESLDLYRRVHGEQHPKVARGLYYLSVAVARGGTGTAEESQLLLREGIAIMRRTDPHNVNLPYMLQSLAGWIMFGEKERKDESRLAEAERLIWEAKQLFVRHYGETHGSTITACHSLAELAHLRGDLSAAEDLHQFSLRHFQQTAEGDYNHIWALYSLGQIKLAQGEKIEAEQLFSQSLNFARRRWETNDLRLVNLSNSIRQARAGAKNN